MSSYIELQTAIDGQDCDPTPQQRAVYSYHEALHSDAADDIYSFEWFQRTKSFFKQFARSDAQATMLTTWEMVEDLDFGAFFLAHPVAAYSLWHLLQSCYELDRVVCGSSREELRIVESWESLKPFVYLKSKKIRTKWSNSLQLLKKKIECGALEGDPLVRRLYDILCGVERLENSLADLKENFSVNLKDMKFVDKMLEKVDRVVDDRCRMIADHLKLEDSQQASRHESESESDEASGDSIHNLQNTASGELPAPPPDPTIALRKRPKRQTSLPKPQKTESKKNSLKDLETTKSEEKLIVTKSFIKFLLYSFLFMAFGLGVSFLSQRFSVSASLSSTLCDFERDFGLYKMPQAMCSNF